MANVKIDGKTYDLESLSKEAKNRLMMVKSCEMKLQELKRELAMVQTARAAYLHGLKPLLPEA